ncbi:MAG TPA: hypothetical protein V6C81_06265 [Planktothrix sp.]|jgi:hypothetical protein
MSDLNVPDVANSAVKLSDDASHRMMSELNSRSDEMGLGEKAARVLAVTGEGLAYTFPGAANAVYQDLRPKNLLRTGEMVVSSVAMGMAMRTALPETGLIAKGVGLVMGGMFAADGLQHVATAYKTVTTQSGDKALNDAAQKMGNGLGEFAVDGGISMVAGGIGAKLTPGIWEATAPDTWARMEDWKAKNLADTTSIGSMVATAGLKFSNSVRGLADRLDPPKTFASDIDPATLKDTLQHVKQSDLAYARSERMYKFGLAGSNGQAHGFDSTLDLLDKGIDPRTVPAETGTVATRMSEMDLTQPDAVRLKGTTGSGAESSKNILGDAAAGQPLGLIPKDAAQRVKDVKHTPEAQDATNAAPTEAQRIMNAQTMGKMAGVIKTVINSVSDQEGMVLDSIHRTTGAVHVRTSVIKPLEGYEIPRDAMLSLAQQAGMDPRAFRQVGPLFERFGDAAVQSGTAAVSDVGAHVNRFNVYAAEHLARYEGNIINQGIDPKVALQRKVVAPLGEATSDLEPIGVDGQGNVQYAHEGPHTVRAIYGPNGEIVWPIDLIKIPLRELGLRGILTGPINGHELTHDQFGRLGEFDPAARNEKLGDAATKALGAEADKEINLPNGGVKPLDVLLNNIERQAKSIKDPQQAQAFLAESLQLDMRSKVAKAGAAADELLGPAGQTQAVQLAQGLVPLDVFIANLAAQADNRAPQAVLAELRGQIDPAQTDQLIDQNLDQILGKNGEMPLQLHDGTATTLKEVTKKVSEMSRNPEFDTYDQALPKTMTVRDVLINLAKGWADETFADWGAASESGQSAAPYFQALRKDGKLAGGTVMGQEMRSEDNPLGLEAHPIDKLRPRYQAALIRELATTGDKPDKLLLDWADALDKYSRDAGQPGDIKLASMDAPGQAITIPEAQIDAFIKELAHQQINTPLPRLQGHTLLDILPDLRKNFRINDDLSTQWANAIKEGRSPDTVPFDGDKIKMTHVFGAGQPAFLKLVADGYDADKANDAINTFSDFFGDKVIATEGTPQPLPLLKKLQLAPKLAVTKPQQYFGVPTAQVLRQVPRATGFLTSNATAIGAGSAAYTVNDLLGMHKLSDQLFGN